MVETHSWKEGKNIWALVIAVSGAVSFLYYDSSSFPKALCVFLVLLLGFVTLPYGRRRVPRPPSLSETADIFAILVGLLGLVATDVAFLEQVNAVREAVVKHNLAGILPLKADWVALQVGHTSVYLLVLVILASLSRSTMAQERNTEDEPESDEENNTDSSTPPTGGSQVRHVETGALFVLAWLAAFVLYTCHVVTAAIDGKAMGFVA